MSRLENIAQIFLAGIAGNSFTSITKSLLDRTPDKQKLELWKASLKKVNSGEKLTAEDLENLREFAQHLRANNDAFGKVKADTIKFFKKLPCNHPSIVRVTLNSMAMCAGFAIGGAPLAIAAKSAVNAALNKALGENQSKGTKDKLIEGTAEALFSTLMGGTTAGVISAGTTTFNELAPKPVRTVTEAASIGYIAQRTVGLSYLNSVQLDSLEDLL